MILPNWSTLLFRAGNFPISFSTNRSPLKLLFLFRSSQSDTIGDRLVEIELCSEQAVVDRAFWFETIRQCD